MLPLPISWTPGPVMRILLLAAVVLPLALVATLGVNLTLTVGARQRVQRQGDALALSVASLEAEAFNDFAATNRTIAAAYVAMNHAHFSRAGALAQEGTSPAAPPSPSPLVETLGQLMDTAHASQCALFTVTLGAVRNGASRELYRLTESPRGKPTGLEQTIGALNTAEFSQALEGTPCGEQHPLPEPGCVHRASCFMRFRAAPDSEDGVPPLRVYSSVRGRLEEDNDEEAWLFMARTVFHPEGPWREPPNMFAPFWRARLPEEPARELVRVEEGG